MKFKVTKNISRFVSLKIRYLSYYLSLYKRKAHLNRILTFDFSKTAKRLIQTGYRRLCEGSKTIEFCQKRDLLDWHYPYSNYYSELKPFNQNLCLSINQSKARLRNQHVIDKDTRHRISKKKLKILLNLIKFKISQLDSHLALIAAFVITRANVLPSAIERVVCLGPDPARKNKEPSTK